MQLFMSPHHKDPAFTILPVSTNYLRSTVHCPDLWKAIRFKIQFQKTRTSGPCWAYQVDLRGLIRSLPYRIESVIYNIKSMLDKNRIDEIEIESMLDKIESMLDKIESMLGAHNKLCTLLSRDLLKTTWIHTLVVLAEVRTTVLLDTIPSLTLCIICSKCKAVG